jgi:hypothetical protein
LLCLRGEVHDVLLKRFEALLSRFRVDSFSTPHGVRGVLDGLGSYAGFLEERRDAGIEDAAEEDVILGDEAVVLQDGEKGQYWLFTAKEREGNAPSPS